MLRQWIWAGRVCVITLINSYTISGGELSRTTPGLSEPGLSEALILEEKEPPLPLHSRGGAVLPGLYQLFKQKNLC